MKVSNLRNKPVTELREEIAIRQKELFNLRLQKAFGQVKSSAFKEARRAIARIKMVLHERAESV